MTEKNDLTNKVLDELTETFFKINLSNEHVKLYALLRYFTDYYGYCVLTQQFIDLTEMESYFLQQKLEDLEKQDLIRIECFLSKNKKLIKRIKVHRFIQFDI